MHGNGLQHECCDAHVKICALELDMQSSLIRVLISNIFFYIQPFLDNLFSSLIFFCYCFISKKDLTGELHLS